MGHTTLGVLPKTRRWIEVATLLSGPADTQTVMAASAFAAERDLLQASNDPVFIEAVRLLLAIPAAARRSDFGDALRSLDLDIHQQPELLDLLAAVSTRLEHVRSRSRSGNDLGELAARAMTSVLSTTIADALPGLFTATPEDVRLAARNLSWNKPVAAYSRQFFASLVADTLSYWLDRHLDTEIGHDKRFDGVGARQAFDREVREFAWESSRIIKEFSGGWYGKTLHRDGGFSPEAAASFGYVALKKIVSDLSTRRGFDV
ncbi:hypothetical protein [Sulfitobacter delicatus]|uniref:Uncharacterized protein n=1 Tax=Sulfitobacter delicatus TaxID=218672 RepID=A0A1G7RC74_9RHOB|nr:hypothetical protein [Sulfitobacter delicatus]SDG08378.1 hypothetical protein SAMN04489759_104341 [Sulfitobacter delicatus]